MIQFTIETEIARPVTEVFAYVTDPTKLATRAPPAESQSSNGAMRTASGTPHRTSSPKRPAGTAAASARIKPIS
jgi:hypothetical protein